MRGAGALKPGSRPLSYLQHINQEADMANIARFDPFNELVDDFFKGFLVRPVIAGAGLRMEVAEKNGAYVVSAELPGVKKEDIQVDIDGAQVTLNAEVKRE